eukprot:scpid5744/ scgid26228/ SAYSvFN domain-containing protein 1
MVLASWGEMDWQALASSWYFKLSLKALLWLLLFAIFVRIEFGTAFFVLSLFYIPYAGTGSDERRKGQPSAYSVFNKDCQSIDGTLTGDQFDKEIRRGGR